MRLHLGCGSVYLRDWVNVDLPGPQTFLASERPDLVEKLITTDDAYYARHSDKNIETLRAGPLAQDTVCDRYGSFTQIPVRPGSVTEMLVRHVFEHLSIAEARAALSSVRDALAPKGILRLDVPDHEGTLEKLIETGDRFYIRHLLGPRRGDRGFHLMSFTRERLKSFAGLQGFEFLEEEPNIHIYPSFCLRFERS